MTDQDNTFAVERQRLAPEGDIARAFNANEISTTWGRPVPVKQPFTENGKLYVTTSMAGGRAATAYQLLPSSEDEKEARSPDGFANRKVEFGGQIYKLAPTPVRVIVRTDDDAEAEPHPSQPPAPPATTTDNLSAAATDSAAADNDDESDEAPSPTEAQTPTTASATEASAEATATTDASKTTASAKADASTTKPAAPPEIKKTYTELLPDRSYDITQAPLKIYLQIFEADGQMLGREIRVTAQIYDDPPLIFRVRETEAGGVDNLSCLARERLSEKLEDYSAAYAREQEEAARQVEAKRERDLAEKVKQKAKEQRKASAKQTTTSKPASSAPSTANAGTAESPGITSDESSEPDVAEETSDETEAIDSADTTTETEENIPVVDDSRPTATSNTVPVSPPPQQMKRPAQTRKATDGQPSLFG